MERIDDEELHREAGLFTKPTPLLASMGARRRYASSLMDRNS
jgi:hypothetical protein